MIFKDAQNDNLRQVAHVEEFVRAGVNLIIISPKEAAPLTKPVSAAFKKGIPVIVLDRRVLGSDYTCFIGADNKRIGKAAGKWIAQFLGGKGKVVELKGLMTSTPGQDRNSGFREGIKGSALEIMFEADMKWLEPNARKEMESALARFSTIDLVYAHNDPGAHGAYLAAKAAGREKKIVFVGIDALPQEGQMYVKQGILAASFEYPTGGTRGNRERTHHPRQANRSRRRSRWHPACSPRQRRQRRRMAVQLREIPMVRFVVALVLLDFHWRFYERTAERSTDWE